MIAQVEAGFPVLSERVPAMIPPMMPPTSKMVDNIAASSASTYNMEIIFGYNIWIFGNIQSQSEQYLDIWI